MKYPLISIIVPVYRVEKYLNRCIESIINQTYENIELILVNDGSPDNSGEICEQWKNRDSRIKVIHKENGGASSARNVGLQNAEGDYICFVDSDDWIEKSMCSRLYELINEKNADMAIGEIRVVKENRITKERKKISIQTWTRKECLNHFFRINGEKDTHSVCARLISKELLKDFTFIEGKMNEDVHACYYLAAKCNDVVYTNETIYNYSINENGVTNSLFNEKKMDLLKMWDIVNDLTKKWTPEYIYASEMNSKRARFTLLSHIYLHGYEVKNENLCRIKKELKREVRKSYFALLKWKMPISRKILLTLVII